jgi:hypothetical protein
MQTGSSGTLVGWKSGQPTFVPLWDRMEGAWLRTLASGLLLQCMFGTSRNHVSCNNGSVTLNTKESCLIQYVAFAFWNRESCKTSLGEIIQEIVRERTAYFNLISLRSLQ